MIQREKKPTVWSMTLVPLGIAAIMTPAIMLAAGGSGTGFDAVVHSIESRYHAHATHIPFLGLISGIARVSTHGGVRGLHVAEFENFRAHADEPVDGAEFNELVEKHVGMGWQRIIRETSRDGSEDSLIYVRAEGEHLGMLVVDLDGKDLDVVQVSVNPDQLTDEISKHHHHRKSDDDSGSDDGVKDEAGE
jgi:hypothetical protein